MSDDDVKRCVEDIEGKLLLCERTCSSLSEIARNMGVNPVSKMNISYFEWLVFLKYFLKNEEIKECILNNLKNSGDIED